VKFWGAAMEGVCCGGQKYWLEDAMAVWFDASGTFKVVLIVL
jgi:uncharacterized protein YfaQ (DUF2300 family)